MTNSKTQKEIEAIFAKLEEPKKCSDCNGEGYIYDSRWKEWFAKHDKKAEHLMGKNKDWMDIDDYDRKLMDYFDVQRREDLPSEEYQCDKCDGEGEIVYFLSENAKNFLIPLLSSHAEHLAKQKDEEFLGMIGEDESVPQYVTTHGTGGELEVVNVTRNKLKAELRNKLKGGKV